MVSRIIVFYLVLSQLYANNQTPDKPPTAFWLYWGNGTNNYNIYNLSDPADIQLDLNFNPLLPTVIYIHAYYDTPMSKSVQTVIGSYLQSRSWNTILLNWETLANRAIKYVTAGIVPVGKKLAQQLMYLFDSGLDVQTIHLVGHSMGAHIAGYAGRYLKTISGQRYILPRITGLDPAYPHFYVNVSYESISKNDADFVDIIHADAGIAGVPKPIGTVDFWPNGGVRSQPGCPIDPYNRLDFCSHHKSVYFWAESIIPKNRAGSFLASSAKNWMNFQKGITNGLIPIHMGVQAPIGSTGKWFLQTNAQTPLSRDFDGYRYIPIT